MIGSLLYLIASRPDLQLSVGICARFQSNPKQSHLNAIKRILKYLADTTNLGLWYEKGTAYNVAGYCDAHFDGDRVERKSTSGCCCFLGKSLITWSSKKQNMIALSTAEVEYVSVVNYCTQILWIKHQLEDFNQKGSSYQKDCLCLKSESKLCRSCNDFETYHVPIIEQSEKTKSLAYYETVPFFFFKPYTSF